MNQAKMSKLSQVIGERIAGLISEQSEAIAAAYEKAYGDCDDPGKFKFPLGMRATITPYGTDNSLIVDVAWSVRHKVSTPSEVIGAGDMFAKEE